LLGNVKEKKKNSSGFNLKQGFLFIKCKKKYKAWLFAHLSILKYFPASNTSFKKNLMNNYFLFTEL